jgi:MtN3 and saliva related transmembrane protein
MIVHVTVYEGIGYLAGFLTTLSVIPQVRQSWRTRSVGDLSLAMLIVLIAGIGLWVVYGVHERNWPIIIANSVNIFLWSSLLWLKVKERRPAED